MNVKRSSHYGLLLIRSPTVQWSWFPKMQTGHLRDIKTCVRFNTTKHQAGKAEILITQLFLFLFPGDCINKSDRTIHKIGIPEICNRCGAVIICGYLFLFIILYTN